MADFVFRLSPNIILGNYSLARIGEEAVKFGNNFMFVADPFFEDLGLIEKIKNALEEKHISLFTFNGFGKTPDSDIIERALSLARGARIRGVIACGDMVACSIGRAIASLYNETKSIYNYIEGEPITAEPLPFIQIPTTCNNPFLFGTTSGILDSRSRTVNLLKIQEGLCKLVIFDSNTYAGLAPNAMTAMSFAGLSTAFEGYVSTKGSFFSETVLGKAISIYLLSLDPQREKLVGTSREELLTQAACLSSMGIAASAPGLGTAISLAAGGKYGIASSLISTILLPYVLNDTISSNLAKTASVARMLGETMPEGGDAVELSKRGIEEIRRQLAEANLPTRLKDIDLTIEALVPVSEDAAKLSFMNYIPHPMSSRDIFEIIKQAF
ncbi:iron-containing alcohol dehydrogenase [Treponema pedis]|uniref:Iron-containing alcohol dehydrogenase n=2 Tax=Treponema pedis TaxID=409322 RepID=S5ZY94_9SPIR|nr:iron-containing alcohol dehydrogenase [Treponema pedis]AGT43003.1 iron-containing alcohol dehydrogenase [Treponema pedis str. T A4]QOW60582.1 iron-containing alcohol dehydrogenase [Treponema pedis]